MFSNKDPPSSSSLPHFLFLAVFFHGSTPMSSDFVPMPPCHVEVTHVQTIQKGPSRPFTGAEVQDTCGALGSRELWQPFRSCDERQKAMLLQKELSIIRFVVIIKLFENTLCNFISYLPQMTNHSWAQLLASLATNRAKESHVITRHQAKSCVQVTDSHPLHLPNRRLAP